MSEGDWFNRATKTFVAKLKAHINYKSSITDNVNDAIGILTSLKKEDSTSHPIAEEYYKENVANGVISSDTPTNTFSKIELFPGVYAIVIFCPVCPGKFKCCGFCGKECLFYDIWYES